MVLSKTDIWYILFVLIIIGTMFIYMYSYDIKVLFHKIKKSYIEKKCKKQKNIIFGEENYKNRYKILRKFIKYGEKYFDGCNKIFLSYYGNDLRRWVIRVECRSLDTCGIYRNGFSHPNSYETAIDIYNFLRKEILKIDFEKKNILLINENIVEAERFKRTLNDCGYKNIFIVHNIDECGNVFHQIGFDLVLINPICFDRKEDREFFLSNRYDYYGKKYYNKIVILSKGLEIRSECKKYINESMIIDVDVDCNEFKIVEKMDEFFRNKKV